MFSGNYAPQDWAFCDGTLLAISQNDVLYSLIGVTYGGDGATNFKLPDLRGRIPIHKGTGPGLTPRTIGQFGGTEAETVNETTMPTHTHPLYASSSAGNGNTPSGTKVPAQIGGSNTPYLYAANATTPVTMNASSVTGITGSQAHSNLMPALCINYIIALNGYYPQQG